MAKKLSKSEDNINIPGHDTKYDYILDWIKESIEQRQPLMALTERAVLAYQGKPSRNRYARTIAQYADYVGRNDPDKAKEIKEACADIPEKSSMVLHNAVETLVSMTQGGVGQYEFGPYDAGANTDDKMMDYLASAAKFFYNEQKMDSILPQYVRMAALGGVGTFHLKDDKDGKICVTLVGNDRMLLDPKRSRVNKERFIGHTERTSLKSIKARILKKKGEYFLKTINEAEVYIGMIKQELNSVYTTSAMNQQPSELRRDVDIFYQPIQRLIQNKRKNDDPEYSYDGDEVEIAYVYDKLEDMYFEVINRRYIVVAGKSKLSRSVKVEYFDNKGEKKSTTKKVKLDDPYVELPFIKNFWDSYAVSPLFYVLDDYDDLCAMESVLYHNLSIMAPITFVGQSSDAEKVSRTSSVSGEVIEGLPQTFGILNKTHDITPVVAAIQRIEEKIKRTLKAVDPFELQAMIGDRASAKEVASASGQVAQGVNPFIANIETSMATLGDKFFKMKIIFGGDTIPFTHEGKYAELDAGEMALDYHIVAKMISSIKLEQEASARRAVELIQFLNGNEAVNQQQFLGTMIPIALNSLVNREQAKNMVNPEYQPMPDEVISEIRRNAEIQARKDEADKLDLSQYSDEELAKIEEAFLTGNSGAIDPFQAEQEALAMAGVEGGGVDPMTGMPVGAEAPVDPTMGVGVPGEIPMDPGMGGAPGPMPVGAPEMAGEQFNDPQGQGFTF